MKISRAIFFLAVLALFVAVIGGLLTVLNYLPDTYPLFKQVGFEMQKAHSIHTSFAIAWIFLAGISAVYFFLENQQLSRSFKIRAWMHVTLWLSAGVGILITLYRGIFSGREYIEYHPVFSLLIFAGWLLFGWNFLSHVLHNFWKSPAYIYMWTVSIFLFAFTYVEGHLWLIPAIGRRPITDLQLQWKAIGAMAGSFNLLVYGTAMYIAELISKDETYAQSRTAFFLFAVGLLNSFTNYAHHTYHLPQSSLVKWISFLVSMLEIIILFRVMSDLVRLTNLKGKSYSTAEQFLNSSKWWTFLNLIISIIISIPPLNSLIHGTHVIVAHAMGTTIGIDTMILLAFGTYGLTISLKRSIYIVGLNLSLGLMMLTLIGSGLTKGVYRLIGAPFPGWMGTLSVVFAISGGACAFIISIICFRIFSSYGSGGRMKL